MSNGYLGVLIAVWLTSNTTMWLFGYLMKLKLKDILIIPNLFTLVLVSMLIGMWIYGVR